MGRALRSLSFPAVRGCCTGKPPAPARRDHGARRNAHKHQYPHGSRAPNPSVLYEKGRRHRADGVDGNMQQDGIPQLSRVGVNVAEDGAQHKGIQKLRQIGVEKREQERAHQYIGADAVSADFIVQQLAEQKLLPHGCQHAGEQKRGQRAAVHLHQGKWVLYRAALKHSQQSCDAEGDEIEQIRHAQTQHQPAQPSSRRQRGAARRAGRAGHEFLQQQDKNRDGNAIQRRIGERPQPPARLQQAAQQCHAGQLERLCYQHQNKVAKPHPGHGVFE